MRFEVRSISERDHHQIMEIVEGLPEWFDEDARSRAIPRDLQNQDGFVALYEVQIVGFITLFFAEGRLNIGWLGARRDYHGRGVGSALLRHAEGFGRRHGIEEIATYTLGDAVDYEPYEATRRFYFRQGFEVYQRNTTDNPGCPEEIRIKKRIKEDM